jgi:hypothetical protein
VDRRNLTRRTFSKFIVGSLASGSVLEAAIQESRIDGGLSDETVMTLLDHLGYKPALSDEVKNLKPLVELAVRDLQTIRDFEVPFTLDPAFSFRPDK